MQEIMLFSAGKKKLDTGPGPKTFKQPALSTDDQGYYGIATYSELMNLDEFKALTGITEGVALASDVNAPQAWFKFAWEGKILFMATRPLMKAVTWKEIYEAGCMTNIEGTGAPPTGVTPTNQRRLITKDGYSYRVYTVNGLDLSPSGTAAIQQAKLASGINFNLLRRCSTAHAVQTRWESYSPSALSSDATSSYTYNSNTTTNLASVWCNFNDFLSSGTTSPVDNRNLFNYRPVLELVRE